MNKMESMPIRKLVLTMSIPIAGSMLISALYNIVDGIFVAQYSGDGFLAVSLAAPVQALMIAVACGLGVGFNTILARFLGQKNEKQAAKATAIGLMLAAAAGLIFAILGLVSSRSFLRLFSNDSVVLEMGTPYLQICTLFSFTIFFQIAFERIMQAVGRPMYNLWIQGVGAVVNIILDPLFIFTFKMGVTGAAIATVTGQGVAMILGSVLTLKKVKEIHLKRQDFNPNWHLVGMIMKIAAPAIVMQAVTSFMSVFMNALLGLNSATAISAFGVYSKLQQFVLMTVLGITNAIIPIIAFNYGAGHGKRIAQTVRFSLELAIGIMAFGTVLFQLFPQALLTLFDADEALMSVGISCLRILSIGFVFMGISLICCASFQALNHSGVSLTITLFRQLFGLIPLSALLMGLFGLDGAWAAFPIIEVIGAAASWVEWKKIRKQRVDPEMNG